MFFAVSVSAHPAWGIAVDRNNQIYFSDIETIWRIDAQGKLTVFRAGVSGRHVHEININEDGNLYGTDNTYEPATQRWTAALWKMTPSGELSLIVAPTSSPPKAMTMWRDRAGNSYYVGQSDNSRHDLFVLKRAADGSVTTLAGNRKAGDEYRQVALYSVGGMAFGPDGTLYFTQNSNVRKVTMDGRMTTLAENLPVENRAESPMSDSRLTTLFGIAVDAQGNSFAADYGNRRILKIGSDGVLTTVAHTEPPWSPTGVVGKDGVLYILEFAFILPSTYTPRVRRMSPDGKMTILANLAESAAPAASQSLPSDSSQTVSRPGPRTPYLLLIGLSIVGLTIVIWRLRRRASTHQQ